MKRVLFKVWENKNEHGHKSNFNDLYGYCYVLYNLLESVDGSFKKLKSGSTDFNFVIKEIILICLNNNEELYKKNYKSIFCLL